MFFSFLLAFRGGGFASPWRVIGDNLIFFSCSVTALKRVPEEHRKVGENLNFIYVYGGG